MRIRPHKGILIGILLLLVLVLILCCVALAGYLEIAEIGQNYVSVKLTDIKILLLSYGSNFLGLFAAFSINAFVIRRVMLSRGSGLVLIREKRYLALLCLVLSVIMTPFISGEIGRQFLEFTNSTPFNMKDPIFGKDIGYYVFQRPFLVSLSNSVLSALLVQVVFCALFYAFLYAQKDMDEFSNIINEKSIIAHNIILVMIFFAVKALTYRLKSEDLLFSTFASLKGAGFTAIQVWHKYFTIAPFLLLLIVIATIIFMLRGRLLRAVFTVTAFPVIWAVFGIVAWGVQVMLVNPYELSMEGRYIDYNIRSTRLAFGITEQDISEITFEPKEELTAKNLGQYENDIERIPLFDGNMHLAAADALQSIKDYYHFKNSTVTKCRIGDRVEAVAIAPREIDTARLGAFEKSYVNERLRYTHGYGLVMRAINRLTDDGQPKYYIKDIPVMSYEGAPEVRQPRIYFGELTNNYVITNSAYREMDYPEGDRTAEYTYTGSAGVPMTFLNRLVFSVRHMDIMMLASGYVNDESRLLDNRNILKRVEKAAPFLTYDQNPYMLIDGEGRLKWIIDAYTTTNNYPYSQSYQGINYLRNSARAVVDAYDGTVDIYMVDTTDPIINTCAKIYPGVIRREPFPRDLEENLRTPLWLFDVKSEVLKRYRETSADSFYFKTTQWTESGARYQAFMRGPDGRERLSVILPYAHRDKGNLAAIFVASADGGNINMRLYKFPKDSAVSDLKTIESKIENDPVISKEISLWTQGGGTVVKGGIGIHRLGNSLVYIQPVYVTGKNPASPPEVKRVVVAYGGRVAMEENIRKALEVILGAQKPQKAEEGANIADLVEKIESSYNDMRNYASEGDWEAFGKKMNELGEAIKELSERKDEILPRPYKGINE